MIIINILFWVGVSVLIMIGLSFVGALWYAFREDFGDLNGQRKNRRQL